MISVRLQCTTAKVNEKIIQRSEFTSHIAANEALYKQRQAMVEHPCSTIKRQWGFDHMITKKRWQAAHADAGLIALAYNLKRRFRGKHL